MRWADKFSERFWGIATRADVLTSLGTFVVSTGVFASVAQQWTAVTGGEWPASIFLGVSTVCAIILTLSIAFALFAVSFRKLKPLAVDTKRPATDPIREPDIAEKSRLDEVERDLLALLDFSVIETTVTFLTDLYDAVPQLEDPLKLEKYDPNMDIEGRKYLQHCAGKLAATHRGFSFGSLMERSAMDAESNLKQVAPDKRPIGIDPIDLRSHAITSLQCGRAKVFLWQEKCEAEQKLIHLRSRLIERLSKRNGT